MAARKIKPPKTASSEGRAFVVVLEAIHAQNRGFGEGLQLLREQMVAGFEEVNRRFEGVARAIGGIGQDIGEIRQGIVEVRQDMGEMRHDIVEIRHDVGLVKIAVLDHSRELKQLGR